MKSIERRGEEAATAVVKSGGCLEARAERRARIREGGRGTIVTIQRVRPLHFWINFTRSQNLTALRIPHQLK